MTETLDPTTKQATTAAKIINSIKADFSAFNMNTWFSNSYDEPTELEPGQPMCGTTACVAGWAAHLNGWKIFSDSSLATKGYLRSSVAEVGARVLELGDNDYLFYTSEDIAVACLLRMAEGEPYSEQMHTEETYRADDAEDAVGTHNYDPLDRARQLLGLDVSKHPVPNYR